MGRRFRTYPLVTRHSSLVTGVVVLLCLLGVAVWAAYPWTGRQAADPAEIFGVEMLGSVGPEQGLAQAVAAGVRWVRVILYWSEIEPVRQVPPVYNWRRYDTLFSAAAAAGLTPIVIITGNPAWAAATPCGPLHQERMGDFRAFLQALVARYGSARSGVRYWELYNEPDNVDLADPGSLGGCWGEDGGAYAQMLRVAYRAIKEADPQAQVLSGGLAHDLFTYDGGPFREAFLDEFLAEGGTSFDILSFHYYRPFHERWDPYGPDLLGKVAYLRGKLADLGLEKTLMATEIGQPTACPPGEECSDDLAARYVVQGFVRGLAAGLRAVIWFTMVDYDDPRAYGLLRQDLTPKPAYQAYRVLTQQLKGAKFSRTLSPGQGGWPDVEGYAFTSRDGGELYVLWAMGFVDQEIAVPGKRLRLVTKEGTENSVSDGYAGDLGGVADGQIVVKVSADPIYLWLDTRDR